jgi:hypothetical protein
MAVGEIGLLDGFDRYSAFNAEGSGFSSTWNVSGAGGAFSGLGAGRFGYRSVVLTFNIDCFRLIPESNLYAFGLAINSLNPASNFGTGGFKYVVLQDENSYDLFGLTFRPDKTFRVLTAAGLEVYDSADQMDFELNQNVWNHYAFEYECSATQGRIKIFVNGDQLAEVSGIDTKGASTTGTGKRFQLRSSGGGVDSSLAYDDLLLFYGGATWPGECKLTPMTETADSLAQWTPKTGTDNFAMIDELQVDLDTTYNSTDVVGERDLFDLENMVDTPDRIFGLQVTMMSRKDDAGTRIITPLMETNGNLHLLTEAYQTSSWVFYRRPMKLNPSTSLEFTKADIDTMKLGYELTA